MSFIKIIFYFLMFWYYVEVAALATDFSMEGAARQGAITPNVNPHKPRANSDYTITRLASNIGCTRKPWVENNVHAPRILRRQS